MSVQPDERSSQRWMSAAAVLVALGIGAGALGAHALRAVLTERQLQSFDTAVDYQLFNALGLFALGLLMKTARVTELRIVAWLLLAGICCFSGGIYAMLAGAPRVFGFITPVGGVMLIVGWLVLAVQLFRASGR